MKSGLVNDEDVKVVTRQIRDRVATVKRDRDRRQSENKESAQSSTQGNNANQQSQSAHQQPGAQGNNNASQQSQTSHQQPNQPGQGKQGQQVPHQQQIQQLDPKFLQQQPYVQGSSSIQQPQQMMQPPLAGSILTNPGQGLHLNSDGTGTDLNNLSIRPLIVNFIVKSKA